MLHLDLFSGIGGFSYAADQVWDDVTHIFCDNDEFCKQVLKKHWPESEIYDDIRKITADTTSQGLEGQNKREARHANSTGHGGVYILTGGFPCQPFSAAGLRRGTADDRYLWPEMLRVIRLTQPQWVIAENVGGFVTWNDGMVLETVCTDLEAAGYEVQPFVIPAVAVNAPHRRDRIWIIAYHDGTGLQEERPEQQATGNRRKDIQHATDTNNRQSRPRIVTQSNEAQKLERSADHRSDWNKDWLEVAAQFCSVDDGLPVELDGFKLTKSRHRAEQLKAYGNAIVPQVALEIMKAIKESNHA